MPDAMSYDAAKRRLHVGDGFIDSVPPEVWDYEVSGMRVLASWFSHRRRERSRPLIGDRPPPSLLGDIQADHWLAEYTAQLMNVPHVLGRLVLLGPAQADRLDRSCAGPRLIAAELVDAGAIATSGDARPKGGPVRHARQADLFD